MKSKRKARGKKKVKYLKIGIETFLKTVYITEILFNSNTFIEVFIFQLTFSRFKKALKSKKIAVLTTYYFFDNALY